MTIAVIIPTFERASYLVSAVQGVRDQSRKDWELVIVDDGSAATAGPRPDLPAGDPRIQLIRQHHAGIAAARNTGLASIDAAVEYVAFLDDDDVWDPLALETLVSALEGHPQAVGAYGMARMIDDQGRDVPNLQAFKRQTVRRGVRLGRIVDWPKGAPTTFGVLAYGNVITTPGQVLIRRSALDRAGPFREPAADWDMWLRLTLHGDLVFVPEVIINYRVHLGNESRDVLKSTRRKLIVHWRLLWAPGLSRAQRRTARLGFLYYYAGPARLARTVRRLAGRGIRAGRA